MGKKPPKPAGVPANPRVKIRNRGAVARKLTLTRLSRAWPTAEQQSALRKQYTALGTPAIVTAILGATLVEHCLDELLREKFRRKDDATWNDLVGESGPLSTFRRKTTAAHAFGLLNDVTLDHIDRIRAIRNCFAHSKTPVDFSHDLIVNELKNVMLPANVRSLRHRHLLTIRRMSCGPQVAFVLLCSMIELDLVRRHVARLKERNRRRKKRFSSPRMALAQALLGYPAATGSGGLPPPPVGRTGGLSQLSPGTGEGGLLGYIEQLHLDKKDK